MTPLKYYHSDQCSSPGIRVLQSIGTFFISVSYWWSIMCNDITKTLLCPWLLFLLTLTSHIISLTGIQPWAEQFVSVQALRVMVIDRIFRLKKLA